MVIQTTIHLPSGERRVSPNGQVSWLEFIIFIHLPGITTSGPGMKTPSYSGATAQDSHLIPYSPQNRGTRKEYLFQYMIFIRSNPIIPAIK